MSGCCKHPNGAISLRSIAEDPRIIDGADEGDTDSVDFCRKWRRIRGNCAGDEKDEGVLIDGVGGTEPDLSQGNDLKSS